MYDKTGLKLNGLRCNINPQKRDKDLFVANDNITLQTSKRAWSHCKHLPSSCYHKTTWLTTQTMRLLWPS